MLKVYSYAKCSTCQKALKFLEKKHVKFTAISIIDTPPSKNELKQMLNHLEGNIRKLFNTSGELYREMGLSQKIMTLTENECLKLLSEHGKLIKRPFILGPSIGLVGFNEEAYTKHFS